jgi:hypothetical protein
MGDAQGSRQPNRPEVINLEPRGPVKKGQAVSFFGSKSKHKASERLVTMDALIRKACELGEKTAHFRVEVILKATLWMEEKCRQVSQP